MILSNYLGRIMAAGAFALAAPLCAQQSPENATSNSAEAAQAESSQAGSDDTIVVTGEIEEAPIAELQRQARAVTMREGNVYRIPLARFEGRLCAGVIGLEVDHAAAMIDRIRENARALDIRVRDDGCDPNFIVTFTPDGESLLRNLIREHPASFQYFNSGEKRRMLAPGPVRVWTTVQMRTLTGMPVTPSNDMTRPPVMQLEGAHSKIYTTTRRDIEAVMVIIDTGAMQGMNAIQLADYATMRGLAQTQPADDPMFDTILALFEGNRADPNWSPPRQLSEFDQAYLQAVYSGIPNLPAIRKLLRVGFEMQGQDEVFRRAED